MIKSALKTVGIVVALSATLSNPAVAQKSTVKDGVFTEEQVAAGEIAYEESCGSCHDMKFYRSIWSYWQDRPLMGFWYRIVAEMPSDNPGSLSDAEYTNIVAYILSDFGFPTGETLLDPSDMEEILIAAP